MGFKVGAYATVWEVKNGTGNYTDVRLSTSKKNKQTDQYETDFSGFVRFIGEAHKNASGLKQKDRIKLGDCEVTNNYNKEKNTTYTNYAIYSFENANGSGQNQTNTPNATNPAASGFVNVPDDVEDDGLPFN